MFAFLEAFEVHDFPEVGVGFVGDVDEVGLYESLRWSWTYLKSLQERIDACHSLIDPLDEARER